jgi:hypothetical protein
MGAFFFSIIFIFMLLIVLGIYPMLPEKWRDWIEN